MKSKGVKITLISLLVLILIYLSGVILFAFKTYPNTFVNGINKGFASVDKLFDLDEVADRTVEVEGRENKKLFLEAEEIGLNVKVVGKPQITQNKFLWFIQVFQKHEYDLPIEVSYDDKEFNDLIEKSEIGKNSTEPEDAYVKFESDKVVIVPEVEGNKLDLKKTKEVIVEALKTGKMTVKLESEYLKPKLTKDSKEIISRKKELDRFSGQKYVFDFEDRKYELSGEKLIEMFDLKGNKYVVNDDRLSDYIAEIAIETDTYGDSRVFNATNIGQITVPAGIYGWQMNVEDTKENLVKMINEKKSGKVEIEYNLEGLSRKKDDIGNTYIEIDLSRQKMWFYLEGELLVETDIVSGNGAHFNAATPVGVNKVWSKEMDKVLVGDNAVSGLPYEYPVKYWMPVGWTGSGIHDSYHRTAYGGDIYMYDGGSSCINTPESAMSVIFENVPLNTPVVIYESSTHNSPTEFQKQDMIREEEKGKNN